MPATPHEPTPELDVLISDQCNGTLDASGFVQLEALLERDREARETYRRSMNLQGALLELAREGSTE